MSPTVAKRDLSIMFARFPYGRIEDPDVTDWLVGAVLAAKEHPRIGQIRRFRGIDTPIPMLRNRAIQAARAEEVDFLVMVDSDMSPDAYLPDNPYRRGAIDSAQPFLQSSLDFAIRYREERELPCVIGAPYCGPPPFENVYVFRWSTNQSDHPDADLSLQPFTREESITLRGIQEVGALPTGLILVDMQGISHLEPPYSYYEWKDRLEQEKASTEDVTFTRDLGLLGVTQFCNWDAWAGHWKPKCVGRPAPVTTRMISDKFRRALRKELNIGDGEELIFVRPEQTGGTLWSSGNGEAEKTAASARCTPGGASCRAAATDEGHLSGDILDGCSPETDCSKAGGAVR